MANTPEIPDKETQEIIDSMKADGVALPHENASGEPETPAEPKAPAEPAKPASSDAPEEDIKLIAKGEEPAKPVVEQEEQANRTPLIPSGRLTKIEKEQKEFFTEIRGLIEGLGKKIDSRPDTEKGQEQADEDIRQFAEANNLHEDVVKGLISIVEKRFPKAQPGDPALTEKLQSVLEEREMDRQEAIFTRDFDKNVLPILQKEFPNATAAEVATVRAKLQELAFTEEYARTTLPVIYKGVDEFRGLITPKGRKSAESGKGGGAPSNTATDYENVTAEDIGKMSDDEFEKFSEEMGRRSKRPIRRAGQSS